MYIFSWYFHPCLFTYAVLHALFFLPHFLWFQSYIFYWFCFVRLLVSGYIFWLFWFILCLLVSFVPS
jgi:hypothetical protein